MFCRRLVATCSFVLMVGFFVGFHVGISNDKVSIQHNHHIKSCSSICYEYEILASNLDIFGLPNL